MPKNSLKRLKELVIPDYDEITISPAKRFEVKSGVLSVSDPANLIDSTHILKLMNVRNGIWLGQTQQVVNILAVEHQKVSYEMLQDELSVVSTPDQAAVLVDELNSKAEFIATRCRLVECMDVYHEDFPDFRELLREMPSRVSVTSGMLGVFDAEEARGYERKADGSNNNLEHDILYSACQNKADNEYQLARLAFGVATHAGFGDGAYPWYAAMDPEGKAIAVRVVFIETIPTDQAEDITNEDDDEEVELTDEDDFIEPPDDD